MFINIGWIFVGKRAFIAGVADDQGFGWAIAKALAAAGAEILVGTWVPVRSMNPIEFRLFQRTTSADLGLLCGVSSDRVSFS